MSERLFEKDLEKIREWVEQGRTDAWIAHQLGVTGSELLDFKRKSGLAPAAEPNEEPALSPDDGPNSEVKLDEKAEQPHSGDAKSGSSESAYEATFDHGDEAGYGFWLDPAVGDDPTYRKHWAEQRAVEVTISDSEIVIRRKN